MKFFRHISYFFYLLCNWGPKIALFSLKEEIRGERKYKINTTDFHNLSGLKIKGKHLHQATEYMPVNYRLLETLLQQMPPEAKKGSFTDVGCGKGRALCVAAHYGFKKLEGIDFAKELAGAAEANLAATKILYPELKYNVRWEDLDDFSVKDDTTCIFIFNPFGEKLIRKLMQKIQLSKAGTRQPLYVIYVSPLFKDLFLQDGFQVVKQTRLMNMIEGVLLKKSGSS